MQTRKIIMDPFVKKLLIWKLYKKTEKQKNKNNFFCETLSMKTWKSTPAVLGISSPGNLHNSN